MVKAGSAKFAVEGLAMLVVIMGVLRYAARAMFACNPGSSSLARQELGGKMGEKFSISPREGAAV